MAQSQTKQVVQQEFPNTPKIADLLVRISLGGKLNRQDKAMAGIYGHALHSAWTTSHVRTEDRAHTKA